MEIKVDNLTFGYGAKRVLNGLSTTFSDGKIYGIVGPNGAGKTTFFKALTNIITKYQGQVSFAGQDIRQNPAVLAKVGILLDDIELYKAYSGWFNLRYFGGLRGTFDETFARELAKNLDIEGALDKKVASYSLGMGKKLLLLVSLMNNAEVLIFDEPFRGIDAKSVAWFREYLLGLKRSGKLILISSHVQEDIEALCDEVLVLNEGKFTENFDLKDDAQILTYTVKVSDPAAFLTVLSNLEITAETFDKTVKFDSTVENFQKVFTAAAQDGVIFDEIKKEARFAEYVK